MLNVRVENNRVYFGERCSVSFQRTLRIPDDGRTYPLPPGLGLFPICRVKDYVSRVPQGWAEADIFIPIYQREALWLGFKGADWKPNAIKVGIGKINAVSGTAWDEELHHDPQDYLVCPQQPWLDGINAGHHFIRQFVAMPLGQGYTVESQITGEENYGGIQLVVYDPKPGRFPDQPPPRQTSGARVLRSPIKQAMAGEMGLGAGGRMKQKIYPDPYGLDTWDINNYGSVFVHLINSQQYLELTNLEPPPTSISAQTYTEYGLPWFDLYDEALSDLAPAESLTQVESVKELDSKKGIEPQDNTSINIESRQIKKLH